MGRVKRIWFLSPMRAAKVQASLRIRAVSPEPPLLAHTSSESRGTFRQKARSPAPLNGWACAVKICHDGMLEDTNSLDAPQIIPSCAENQGKGLRKWWKIAGWKGPTKNQTSSPTGWLRMRVWKMSLRRTKSAIISWDGLSHIHRHETQRKAENKHW